MRDSGLQGKPQTPLEMPERQWAKQAKKAGKAVGKAVSGKGKKGHKGRDMTGLTFVCKAVDFGPSMMGPMGGAPLPGAIPVAGGKKGGKGKNRRGPRANPTSGLKADLATKKGRKQLRNNM